MKEILKWLGFGLRVKSSINASKNQRRADERLEMAREKHQMAKERHAKAMKK
ncbi:hypothetical protein ACSWYU_004701 [Vibrio harveyi]|jgi:hypothetical protein